MVPGRESYGDWNHIKGLNVTGCTSFFPHMDDKWKELIDRRTKQLLFDIAKATIPSSAHSLPSSQDQSLASSSVRCIRDDEAYVVDGREKQIIKLS